MSRKMKLLRLAGPLLLILCPFAVAQDEAEQTPPADLAKFVGVWEYKDANLHELFIFRWNDNKSLLNVDLWPVNDDLSTSNLFGYMGYDQIKEKISIILIDNNRGQFLVLEEVKREGNGFYFRMKVLNPPNADLDEIYVKLAVDDSTITETLSMKLEEWNEIQRMVYKKLE